MTDTGAIPFGEPKPELLACLPVPCQLSYAPAMLTVAVYSLDLPTYACAELRLLGPARALAGEVTLRWAVTHSSGDYALDAQALDGADIVVFQRYFPMEATWPLVEKALGSGLPVVYETDDDFLHVPADHPMFTRLGPVRPYARELVRRAALVTVSTRELARGMGGAARKVAVLPNGLDGVLWALGDGGPGPAGLRAPAEAACAPQGLEAGKERPVRIVFAGTASHGRDLDLVAPAIRAVAGRFGAAVEFIFFGQAPQDVPGRCVAFEEDYASYARALTGLAPDIALAPLEDTPFNRAKSAVKWLEYSAAGAAGVYSHLPAYELVSHGRTGLVAGPDWREWEQAIAGLVEDAVLRRSLAEAARREVCSRWRLDRLARRFLAVWREAADMGRPGGGRR